MEKTREYAEGYLAGLTRAHEIVATSLSDLERAEDCNPGLDLSAEQSQTLVIDRRILAAIEEER